MGSSLPPASLAKLGGSKKLQLIAQRCGQNGEAGSVGSGNPYLNTHSRHLCPGGADAIQLVYSGMAQLPVETPMAPNVFSARDVTLSGGTGYVAGEIMTYALTTTTGGSAVQVMVTAVNAGVPTQWQVVNGGMYNTPLGSGVSQASTTGSGTGATATFTWRAYAVGGHVGIEPVFGQQVFAGQNAVQMVRNGLRPDGKVNWDILVPMGDLWVSDLISVDVPVGGALGLRADWLYNNFQTGRYPMITNYGSASNVEQANNITAWFDQSYTGTITAGASKTIYQPIAILGIPKVAMPSVVAIGDSRTVGVSSGLNSITGNHDILDVDGNIGWFEKALSATVGQCYWPYSNLAHSSDSLAQAIPANGGLTGRMQRLKAIALMQPTAVFVGLSVNDFSAGASLATVQAQEQQFVQELRGCGVKYIFTATTDPHTTSTDSWATTTNQTGYTGTANIIARNAALRAGTYNAGYDFFMDMSPAVESAVGSGLWLANGTANYPTGDGVHASPPLITSKAAIAAAVMSANISL